MRRAIFLAGATLAIISFTVLTILYFQNWDVIMSSKEWFMISWKSLTGLVIGGFMCSLANDRK